jgi:hypothetical protein
VEGELVMKDMDEIWVVVVNGIVFETGVKRRRKLWERTRIDAWPAAWIEVFPVVTQGEGKGSRETIYATLAG